MLEIGKTTMVVSVPRELSSDHSAVLLLAEASGRITEADISERLQWEGGRPRRVLDELMQVKTMRCLQSAFRYDTAFLFIACVLFLSADLLSQQCCLV